MKHQIKFRWLLSLVILTCIFSCKKDFLDVTGVSSPLYRENYVKDLNSMEEYLNGNYLEFNTCWINSTNAGYTEYVADNLKPVSTDNPDIIAYYKWAQNPFGGNSPGYSATNMSTDWQKGYRVIRISDFVIEEVDKYRKDNPAKADHMKGQALFFRAIMHLKLVNTFAQPYQFTANASHPGVPYITTYNLSAPYSRQSVKEVYDAMISDLRNAIALMNTVSTPDNRFAGVDAAKALLARVYLFKGDYASALNLAREISTKYPLMSIANGYPDGLFAHKAAGGSEVIFQATPCNDYLLTTTFLGTYLKGPLLRFYATGDIATILQESNADVRAVWVTAASGNWMVTKFPPGAAGGMRSNPDGDYYEPVLRSSEMFLTVAEAAFKTNDENTAREYLNAIRKRADPSAANVTASGQPLLDLIYRERRKELCFENLRLFDLQRQGLGINRGDILPGSPTALPYPDNKAIAPIPQLDVNIMGLKQNEGY